MTLTVTGVETIEITDPNGVCENQQRQKARSAPDPSPLDILKGRQPNPPYVPLPGIPAPINPIPLPEIGTWRRQQGPATYEQLYDPHAKEKWQVGLTGDPLGAVPFTTAATGDPTQSEKLGKSMRSTYGNGDTKETQNNYRG